jgi:hypothetical protein
MDIQTGRGKTEFGPGVDISLSGDEVATAIDAWLVAQGVCVCGPRTVTVNGELCETGHIYVDPSGSVVYRGDRYRGDRECAIDLNAAFDQFDQNLSEARKLCQEGIELCDEALHPLRRLKRLFRRRRKREDPE